ncbi:MAG: hypothetical protein HUU46_12640 [Candidatus Hydrogenedentes bacterium]|nr:hypothetical protein [Candidatus Hydrogenedentota bacterium]
MSTQVIGLRVAAVIFGLVCLAQFIRFISGTSVIVASHALPLWPSAVAAVVAGGLCIWLWSLTVGGGRHQH